MMIIDRFEGDFAVIEYGRRTFNIPKVLIPQGAKEGDVIKISISLDHIATEDRKKKNQKLMDDLFED